MSNTVNFVKPIAWTMLLIVSGLASAEQQAFRVGSLDQIERQFAGEPFLLVLWSADCVPCRTELAVLGETSRLHTQMNYVLVATDSIDMQSTLVEILEENGLGDAESWIFADPNIERLRYAIDPDWFGELPRSYFYDERSKRKGTSGLLSKEAIYRGLRL
jgi:hypothetical protein